MNGIYPWHRNVWRQLWSARQADRLPHALLLSAPAGSGLSEFVAALSIAVLCMSPTTEGVACKSCKSCVLFQAENHPDYLGIFPEEDGGTIKVDQVRSVGEFFASVGQYSARRVVVLEPAERMNQHAANSLLKTLEEPPLGCLLLLISARPMALPITVRSRCQSIRFPRTVDKYKSTWVSEQVAGADVELLLALVDNAPLAAVDLANSGGLTARDQFLADLEALSTGQADPILVSGRWSDLEFSFVIQWLIKLVDDLIRLCVSSDCPTVINRDLVPRLRRLASTQPASRLFAARELLLQDQRFLAAISGLTPLNFYEEFTMKWVGASFFR